MKNLFIQRFLIHCCLNSRRETHFAISWNRIRKFLHCLPKTKGSKSSKIFLLELFKLHEKGKVFFKTKFEEVFYQKETYKKWTELKTGWLVTT